MTLPELEALGAYLNAGFIDYYDGVKHHRLGEATPGGDILLSDEGESLAKSLVRPTVKRIKARKQMPDEGVEDKTEADMLSELDSLLP